MAVPELAAEAPAPAGGAYANGTLSGGARGDGRVSAPASDQKKIRESERRRRRRKQKKKNSKGSSLVANGGVEEGDSGEDEDEAKENADPQKLDETVEVEYVPEKADIEDFFLEDFKKVFEKFSFSDSAAGTEDDAKKDEAANAATNRKSDSDSDEEEQGIQTKEKGVSNKKKKLQRRMKIAELKQICSRPDVVEIWDATSADPKLLVYLKSYRNTVPVPRHWCQKRKFLQGTGCNNILGARTS